MQIIRTYQFSRRNFEADLSSIYALRRAAKAKHINSRQLLEKLAETCVQIIRFRKKHHQITDDNKDEIEPIYKELEEQYKQINDLLKGSGYNVFDVLKQGYPETVKNEDRIGWLKLDKMEEESGKDAENEEESHHVEIPKFNSNNVIVVDISDSDDPGESLGKINIAKQEETHKALKRCIKTENKTLFEKAQDAVADYFKGGVLGQLAKILLPGAGLAAMIALVKNMEFLWSNKQFLLGKCEQISKGKNLTLVERFKAAERVLKSVPGKKPKITILTRAMIVVGTKFPKFLKVMAHVCHFCVDPLFYVQVGVWIGESLLAGGLKVGYTVAKGNADYAKGIAMRIKNLARVLGDPENPKNGRGFKYLDFEAAEKIDLDSLHHQEIFDHAGGAPVAVYFDKENEHQAGVVVVTVKTDAAFTTEKINKATDVLKIGESEVNKVYKYEYAPKDAKVMDKFEIDENNQKYRIFEDKDGNKIKQIEVRRIKADSDERRTIRLWVIPNKEEADACELMEMKNVDGDMYKEFITKLLSKKDPGIIEIRDPQNPEDKYIRTDDPDFSNYQYLFEIDSTSVFNHAKTVFKGNEGSWSSLLNSLRHVSVYIMDFFTESTSQAYKGAMLGKESDDLVQTSGTLDPMNFIFDFEGATESWGNTFQLYGRKKRPMT